MCWLWTTALAAPDLVLISMDTVRADAVSAYGVPPGPYRAPTDVTPTLDTLAAEGVRFGSFFTHAPSTLSSHTTMMTGLDPHGHAVPRNGFPVRRDLPTLAERLRDAGYDAIAVVGSAALESAMGLDRGFRVYDDTQTREVGSSYESPADNVVARALAAVDARPDPERPLFLFVHFYDAHAPYSPPPGFDRFADPSFPMDLTGEGDRFRDLIGRMRRDEADPSEIERIGSLYLGEVAFVDAQIAVLVAGLEARGLLRRDGARPGLLAVTADHGETLGDDRTFAWSHGSNVGLEVMHVPLVVSGRGLALARGAVVHSPAAMNGLPSTLLAVLGHREPLGTGVPFDERLSPAPIDDRTGWPEHPTIPVLFEATRPRQLEHPTAWNNLRMYRGVVIGASGGYLTPYVAVPFRSYAATPTDRSLADWLTGYLAAWDVGAPGHVTAEAAPETTAALEALGYVE